MKSKKTLGQRIENGPIASTEGAARLADLAAGHEGLAALLARKPLRGFLAGMFEGSPFLREGCERDPGRLARLLAADPEEAAAAALAAMRAAADGAEDQAQVMARMRVARLDAAVLAALADLGGVWDARRVTAFLSDLFDAAISAALRHLLGEAAAAGRFRPRDPADPEAGSGLIVLAMGKLGAGEVNYSSDIDLIVFYDPDVAPLGDGVEAAPFFVRLTQQLVRMLQERTAEGYVARTDLRLRPDPGSTQVAIPLEAGLLYYESVGQNWERAAMIKARPCAGDIPAGEAFLAELAPFIWRKYLDYAAIADIHAMKRQIHAHRGHGAIAVEGHNVKLGRGGIREVEFFAQTQQLVAGGRDPALRIRPTEEALAALAAAGWIDAEARDEMTEAYWFLRGVEHRIQMVADEQAHTLPDETPELERFARFCGYDGRDAFAAALTARLETVQRHYAELFEDAPTLSGSTGSLVFTGEEDDPDTIANLAAMRFEDPARVSALVRGWHRGRYQSMRSARARELMTELVPPLLQAFSETLRPDAALIAFDRVLGRLPAGVQFLSLLRSNARFLGLLADVLGAAPRLGEMIARRPHVLDAVMDPAFFSHVPSGAEVAGRLRVALGDARGYEDLLDRARIFGQEQGVLIGVRVLSGTLTPEMAGAAFTRLADALIAALADAALKEIRRAHGKVPGGELAVVALGRLGGSEMTAGSDLDLIVIYDHDDGVTGSDGKKELSPPQYFARAAQRIVAALTAPTAEGTLYEVDMRLRPSGRAGPLATRLAAFELYQAEEAWTWEHMALTRARPISGSAAFRGRVNAAIHKALCMKRDAAKVAREVREMRALIAEEKGDADIWDLKLARGGMVDIDFIAQYLQIVHAHAMPEILSLWTPAVMDTASEAGLISEADWDLLRTAQRRYHALTQVLRLCLTEPFDPDTAGEGLKRLLARAAEAPDFAALEAELRETQEKVREAFDRVLGA